MKRKLYFLAFLMCFLGALNTMNAQVTTFVETFDEGISSNWRIFDEDSDEYQWISTGDNTDGKSGEGVVSWTYFSGDLYPDNYIVTKSAYTITEESILTYWIKAYDYITSYNNEYYSVVVSTDGETWTSIISKSHTKDWTQETVNFADYQEYVGKSIYFGFRHHNCNGAKATGLIIDEVSLTGIATGGEGGDTPTAPSAPTNLTATAEETSILLKWDAVDGATSYKVYQKGNNVAIATGDAKSPLT